jgi:hypothetical protein
MIMMTTAPVAATATTRTHDDDDNSFFLSNLNHCKYLMDVGLEVKTCESKERESMKSSVI